MRHALVDGFSLEVIRLDMAGIGPCNLGNMEIVFRMEWGMG